MSVQTTLRVTDILYHFDHVRCLNGNELHCCICKEVKFAKVPNDFKMHTPSLEGKIILNLEHRQTGIRHEKKNRAHEERNMADAPQEDWKVRVHVKRRPQ